LGRKTIQASDLNRIGGWLSQRLPIGKIRTVADFDQAFRGGQAVKRAGTVLQETYDHVEQQMGNRALDVGLVHPVAQQMGMPRKMSMPFHEVNDLIRQVEDLGWSLSGDPKTQPVGKLMRTTAHEMVEDLAGALNQFKPGLGDRYFKSRRQFAVTTVMQKIFREPGVIDEAGNVAMPKLQQLVSEAGGAGYREELENLLGPDGAKSFLGAVFSGAPPLARNISGHGIAGRAYVHGSMEPSFSLHAPKFAKHVGNVPIDLGRGRALAAGLTLGPTKLMQVLSQYANAPSEQPKSAAPPGRQSP
jgi:hypothetical protein